MAVMDQVLTDRYALYCGDSCEVLKTIPDASVHMSIYSPPFCGLYNYSSDERDLSNCSDYDEFFKHYEYIVKEIYRTTCRVAYQPFIVLTFHKLVLVLAVVLGISPVILSVSMSGRGLPIVPDTMFGKSRWGYVGGRWPRAYHMPRW